MASVDDRVPNKAGVEKQLARMLASKRLKNAPAQSDLLKYVVEKRLENIRITEAIIGPEVFPGWTKDGSDDVRIAAKNLRETLTRYYAEEGAADPVVITLPRGPGYRPLFSYSSPAVKFYARGRDQFAALTIRRDHLSATSHINKAIALDPSYAPAHAVLAEIRLTYATYGEFPDTKEHVARAEASAKEALRLSSGLWRPYVVLGIVHSSRGAWGKAEASFKAALKASREDTERHAWYAAYLLATGRKRKARQLVAEAAREAPGDLVAQSVHALFLYAMRDFEAAEALLGDMQHSNHWLSKVALACIRLHRGSHAAWFYLNRAHIFFGIEVFPGFEALCLRGGDAEAQQMGEAMARDRLPHLKRAPLQSALCHLALDEPQKAIAELRRARDEHEPLMIWAHLWPFFDPLRKHPAFRQLVRGMHFPSTR